MHTSINVHIYTPLCVYLSINLDVELEIHNNILILVLVPEGDTINIY